MNRRAQGKSGGVELTDELIERLADEAAKGYELRRLRRRKGRPSIGAMPAAVFQVRLEPELRDALERAANRERTSPSELTRRALRNYLRAPSPRRTPSTRN